MRSDADQKPLANEDDITLQRKIVIIIFVLYFCVDLLLDFRAIFIILCYQIRKMFLKQSLFVLSSLASLFTNAAATEFRVFFLLRVSFDDSIFTWLQQIYNQCQFSRCLEIKKIIQGEKELSVKLSYMEINMSLYLTWLTKRMLLLPFAKRMNIYCTTIVKHNIQFQWT